MQKKISNITTLKLTRLNEDIEKCGFPRNSRDKYMKIFNNLDMDIVIVKDIIDIDKKIINKIKKLDLDNLTPVMALNIIIELRKMIDE